MWWYTKMSKLTLICRVVSPELKPRYIVKDEQEELRLLKSDSELLAISDRLKNFSVGVNYGKAYTRGIQNSSSLIFRPIECNGVYQTIESITVSIPASYWYTRVNSGMTKSAIVNNFIKDNVTDRM